MQTKFIWLVNKHFTIIIHVIIHGLLVTLSRQGKILSISRIVVIVLHVYKRAEQKSLALDIIGDPENQS